jgi:small-conductance mechanosensitive channel
LRLIYFFIFILHTTLVLAQENNDANVTKDFNTTTEKLSILDKDISSNIWINKYESYITFIKIQDEILSINKKLKQLKRKRLTKKIKIKINDLKLLQSNKNNELKLLSEYKNSIFGNLEATPNIQDPPKVTNPIIAISALSYIKQLEQDTTYLDERYALIEDAIALVDKKIQLLKSIINLTLSKDIIKIYKNKLSTSKIILSKLQIALEHLDTTYNVFKTNANEIKLALNEDIKAQIIKVLYIFVFVILLIVLGFILKLILKKYTATNKTMDENSYFIHKIINISIVIVSILILFFSYIEDVTYLATVLGFASAGIAIAMKDWFMSVLGWFSILIGGSIHVGDRIKIIYENQEIIGDVLDISILKITIHEDITLTSYTNIRRAGRIIFVPNHYIFTQAIYNYSHAGLKTVWDGIDFLITFNSNHKKANMIAKEIAIKYSQGYVDITRKQLNKLRQTYNLRNTNVEPKAYTFIDDNGIKISIWYQTNSFATLPLRSTISTEILDRFIQEDDIHIAYNTQTININKSEKSRHQI